MSGASNGGGDGPSAPPPAPVPRGPVPKRGDVLRNILKGS